MSEENARRPAEIGIEEFGRVDLRVARVIRAEPQFWAACHSAALCSISNRPMPTRLRRSPASKT